MSYYGRSKYTLNTTFLYDRDRKIGSSEFLETLRKGYSYAVLKNGDNFNSHNRRGNYYLTFQIARLRRKEKTPEDYLYIPYGGSDRNSIYSPCDSFFYEEYQRKFQGNNGAPFGSTYGEANRFISYKAIPNPHGISKEKEYFMGGEEGFQVDPMYSVIWDSSLRYEERLYNRGVQMVEGFDSYTGTAWENLDDPIKDFLMIALGEGVERKFRSFRLSGGWTVTFYIGDMGLSSDDIKVEMCLAYVPVIRYIAERQEWQVGILGGEGATVFNAYAHRVIVENSFKPYDFGDYQTPSLDVNIDILGEHTEVKGLQELKDFLPEISGILDKVQDYSKLNLGTGESLKGELSPISFSGEEGFITLAANFLVGVSSGSEGAYSECYGKYESLPDIQIDSEVLKGFTECKAELEELKPFFESKTFENYVAETGRGRTGFDFDFRYKIQKSDSGECSLWWGYFETFDGWINEIDKTEMIKKMMVQEEEKTDEEREQEEVIKNKVILPLYIDNGIRLVGG